KELIEYKRNFGVTAVYVTHDQIEAMSLASRIVLLMDGKIIQVGTPNQMYYDPSHLKTIEFIGSNEANILFGHISDHTFIKDQLKLKLSKEQLEKLKDYNEVYLVIRPEDVIVSNEKRPGYLEANIIFSENFGKDQL